MKNNKYNNIIFLDFQGVLTNYNYCRSRTDTLNESLNKAMNRSLGYALYECDPKNVNILRSICEATNSQISFASTIRGSLTEGELIKMMRLKGWDEVPRRLFRPPYTPRLSSGHRGEEIQSWLDQNECNNYLILDDNWHVLKTQKENFLKVNPEIGLCEEDIGKAINILSTPGEANDSPIIL